MLSILLLLVLANCTATTPTLTPTNSPTIPLPTSTLIPTPVPTLAPTPTPIPTATPTPTPTPTSTATPTATPTPRPTVLSLNGYLVLALRVGTDLSTITTDRLNTLPELQGDPEALRRTAVQFARNLDRTAKEALETLADVTTPREAQAYHQTLLLILRGYEKFAGDFGVALETQDSSRSEAATRGLFALFQELGPLATQGQSLVIISLEAEPSDPLNAYLIAAAEARLKTAALLEDFQVKLVEASATAQKEGNVNAIYAVFGEIIASTERFEDEWLRLTPPAEAQDLHQRQSDLNAELIAVNRRLLAALREGDEAALLQAQQSQIEVGAEASHFGADWSELLIKALAR